MPLQVRELPIGVQVEPLTVSSCFANALQPTAPTRDDLLETAQGLGGFGAALESQRGHFPEAHLLPVSLHTGTWPSFRSPQAPLSSAAEKILQDSRLAQAEQALFQLP